MRGPRAGWGRALTGAGGPAGGSASGRAGGRTDGRATEAYALPLPKLPAAADRPREVIGDSWRRAEESGLDRECGRPRRQVGVAELEWRRRTAGVGALREVLRDGLIPAEDTVPEHVVVVTDADGVVLWRDGERAMLKAVSRIGLAEGASWSEDSVGTNGIGTALATGHPVGVYGDEHFLRTCRRWSCAAAPLTDPRDGRLLGVVNVTGPARTMPTMSLAFVTAVGRVAEGELRDRHWTAMERLRAVAAPVLAGVGGRVLAVDEHGWAAAATGMVPPERVALPKSPAAGPCVLPGLGRCALEPLPGGGWLVRVEPEGTAAAPTRVVLDLTRPASPSLAVLGGAGRWSQQVSPRHAELLYLLAVHRDGFSSTALADALFGDPGRTVTVRAELSRLRRKLGGLLAHRPYRFSDEVDVQLLLPTRPADLLPRSTAPAVLAARS
ncbi:GAF domain-containing protein [Streptomyces sp. WMMC500]|uniref:helix-turn-helix domain-containing protein n=1 Tax=Streptomyces sp. WMMC500 TaxID=3015154 RepID=UPI00248B2708|nr:helix-turn-helix domain-containing protein [Streptomyces sp. WMMC500]WBB62222.1 GAF domain-containing protein [Streptomyces sp. WMMC500]